MADQRQYLQKGEIARRLINQAIRLVAVGEDAVATHVLIGSAETLTQEYAKASGKPLIADVKLYAKPEFAVELAAFLKSRYNFFKHANRDHDHEIDATNLSVHNELALLTAVAEYENIFATASRQMLLFKWAMILRDPSRMRLADEVLALISELGPISDGEATAFLRHSLATDAEALAEILQDRLPFVALSNEGYYDAPGRDTLKRRIAATEADATPASDQ